MNQHGGGKPPHGAPPWPAPPWPAQPQQHASHPQHPQQPQQPPPAQPPPQAWPQQPPHGHPVAPPQPPPGAPWPQPPPPYHQQATAAPSAGPGVKTALGRAFRLRVDPAEVTPHERATLAAHGIHAPEFQAFLAWRRSVLFVAALGLIPVTVLRFLEATAEDNPETIRSLFLLPAIMDGVFTLICWTQLGRWMNWQRQRKVLMYSWLAFFATPFLIYLYPLRDAFADQGPEAALLYGLIGSIYAIMVLAPKAISVMPALVRAAITTKLLFPGNAAPGWLITLLAPIYGLLLYIVLVMPYQVVGDGWFIGAMVGLIGAQVWLARAGHKLARPEPLAEALRLVSRIRAGYLVLMLAGLGCLAIAMHGLITTLEIPWTAAINLALAFVTNLLVLTLITTDLVINSLHRAQVLGADPAVANMQAASAERLTHFVSQR